MTVTQLINKVTTEILNPFIILLFALATVVFAWGVVQYIIGSQGSPERAQTGKRIMFYGIIGMFIMASAWGIVFLLCDFFGTCEAIHPPLEGGTDDTFFEL